MTHGADIRLHCVGAFKDLQGALIKGLPLGGQDKRAFRAITSWTPRCRSN